jgi:biopolymer transport protein ExbD
MSRAREMRAQRRAAQFAKFRIIQLNLVPLVDTMVSIVFFALTTQTVGELAPVLPGINLPDSRVGQTAHQQITLGVGSQVTLAGNPVMSTVEAAQAQSTDPSQPLLIPPLYAALRGAADSIRRANRIGQTQSIDVPLAVQADRTLRYDLLSRMLQTARLAGFRNLSLQVNKTETAVPQTTADAR